MTQRIETNNVNAGPDGSQRSVGELMSEVSSDLSTLVRQEIELAKAEVRQEARSAGRAAGMFAGAGLGAYMVLLFLSIALWWGLGNVMDGGWSALIVAGIWAIVAAVLFSVARSRAKELRAMPRTVDTVKQIPDALRPEGGSPR